MVVVHFAGDARAVRVRLGLLADLLAQGGVDRTKPFLEFDVDQVHHLEGSCLDIVRPARQDEWGTVVASITWLGRGNARRGDTWEGGGGGEKERRVDERGVSGRLHVHVQLYDLRLLRYHRCHR